MITNSPDHGKKSSFLEKIGQKVPTIKEITDNIERRKLLHNKFNQIHYITNQSEESLIIEKKPSTPIEIRQRKNSGRILIIEQFTYIVGAKKNISNLYRI